MNLIFEGLQRRTSQKKEMAPNSNGASLSSDCTSAEPSSETPVSSEESYAKDIASGEYFRTTVDRSKKERSKRHDLDLARIFRASQRTTIHTLDPSRRQLFTVRDSNQSPPSLKPTGKKGKRPTFNFLQNPGGTFNIFHLLNGMLVGAFTLGENLFIAPYEILKLIGGTAFKSIKFCLNFIALLFTKIVQNIAHFIHSCFMAFRKTVDTVMGYFYYTLRDGFFSIYNLYKSIFCKIFSIYLPNRWIQGATIFLIKSFAMAASCCLMIMLANHIFHGGKMPTVAQSNQGAKSGKTSVPKRKLKHGFRDPLVVQRDKICGTLMAFHIDAIQRHADGMGNLIIDNQVFRPGALLSVHPKIHLEKIGKRSLYFSDKYGQRYKRSIERMLE
ncbi:MAG: hypothetical protein LBN94_01125 [Puniceicoccales bacterium]|jgi:hypothetical protein|nr:hypothetical protein [Puniceicoccales bacterium]